MDKDILNAKEFFVGMRDAAQHILDLIDRTENGDEPTDDEVAMALGKLLLLQSKGQEL